MRNRSAPRGGVGILEREHGVSIVAPDSLAAPSFTQAGNHAPRLLSSRLAASPESLAPVAVAARGEHELVAAGRPAAARRRSRKTTLQGSSARTGWASSPASRSTGEAVLVTTADRPAPPCWAVGGKVRSGTGRGALNGRASAAPGAAQPARDLDPLPWLVALWSPPAALRAPSGGNVPGPSVIRSFGRMLEEVARSPTNHALGAPSIAPRPPWEVSPARPIPPARPLKTVAPPAIRPLSPPRAGGSGSRSPERHLVVVRVRSRSRRRHVPEIERRARRSCPSAFFALDSQPPASHVRCARKAI